MRPVRRENGDWFHEFVGHALLVETADRLDRIFRLSADAEGHEVVAALDAVPPFVAIHREIAADDGREIFLIGEIAFGRFRRRVAAVEDRVNENVLRTDCQRRVDESVEMRLQRMHPAIGQQSDEMDRPAAFHRVDQHAIVAKLIVLDRFADSKNVLIDHSAGADVQMTDFGVSHLTFRKADRRSGRVQRRPRRLPKQPVKARRRCLCDRVPLTLFAASESVEDDENEKRASLRHGGGILVGKSGSWKARKRPPVPTS